MYRNQVLEMLNPIDPKEPNFAPITYRQLNNLLPFRRLQLSFTDPIRRTMLCNTTEHGHKKTRNDHKFESKSFMLSQFYKKTEPTIKSNTFRNICLLAP